MIVPFRGVTPTIGADVFIEATARVIGDVVIGTESSVWFQTVIRGDVNFIRIGARTNLQDQVMVHVSHERHPTVIGDGVTIGHRAVVHGCTIGDGCLIGIGAIVLDGAVIEPGAMVGAGALVSPRTVIPSGKLALGQPARVVRDLRPDELERMAKTAVQYCDLARSYR